MANTIKHAAATTVRIRVQHNDGFVRLDITDDGTGGAVPTPGGRLQGLADRVAAVGGHLRIASAAGSGTTLSAELPCES
jgi:signal transduction histidine kinase